MLHLLFAVVAADVIQTDWQMARDGKIPDVFPTECGNKTVRWNTGYIAIDNIVTDEE